MDNFPAQKIIACWSKSRNKILIFKLNLSNNKIEPWAAKRIFEPLWMIHDMLVRISKPFLNQILKEFLEWFIKITIEGII